jgi:hypothetical protein
LLLAVAYMMKLNAMITRIIGGVVCALGVAIIAIGAEIASKYGQKQFGLIGAGIGAVLIALGINSIINPPPAAGAITSQGAAGGQAAANTGMGTGNTFNITINEAPVTPVASVAPVSSVPLGATDLPPIDPGLS